MHKNFCVLCFLPETRMEETRMQRVMPVQDVTGKRKSKVLVCLLYFSASKLLLLFYICCHTSFKRAH